MLRLQELFNSALFVCTNLNQKLLSIDTEFKYFHGIGKNMRYLESKNNYFGDRSYKYLPVVLKANYKLQQVEDFCIILISFVPVCYYQT